MSTDADKIKKLEQQVEQLTTLLFMLTSVFSTYILYYKGTTYESYYLVSLSLPLL